ncbi:MAG TPA: hypothetical protein VGB63_16070 [Pedobacter sp.]|jgi:hypothetical protein
MVGKDLRVGNYIQRFDEIEQVETIDNYSAILYSGDKCFLANLEGIPITDVLLLLMGFQDTADNGHSYRISVNATDELCWYRQLGRIMYQTRDSGFTRDFNIQYAHQLQNLYFALTGEELTIKKPDETQ